MPPTMLSAPARQRIFSLDQKRANQPMARRLKWERISAKDDKGVLEVFVPKTSKPEPKRVTVQ